MTRHPYDPVFYAEDFCHECGEPRTDPVHIRAGESCQDCGNELALHSDQHPCPNPPVLDPRD